MIIPNSIYIAGPMSGLPEFNYPAFRAAARYLRGRGWYVVNPADINADAVEAQRPWADCMRLDIAELVKCQTVYMLPGWETSQGATLEHHLARRLGLHIIYAGDV